MTKKILICRVGVMMMTPTLISAGDYTPELQDAYQYARAISITTQPTIDSANMYGSLIRSHMAKMMVNYAKTVLGKTGDVSLPCNFTDIGGQSAELQSYIKQACQMGLMGVGITKFNPGGIVTRAQFGTVLSRALYDDFYNDGNPYYYFHLQALQEAGIMKNISNPDANEIRGYVMVMMMRAGGEIEIASSQCQNESTQLLCLIGSADCPSECQAANTTAGGLQVTKFSREVGTIATTSKYVGSFTFSASASDVTITSLTFQKIGSFVRGRIEKDGITIGTSKTISSDASMTIRFTPGIKIIQGDSSTFDVFVENSSVQEQGVSIASKSAIAATAENISGTFPLRLAE